MPTRGCCSAPATTSRSRGRSARSTTWPARCRRRWRRRWPPARRRTRSTACCWPSSRCRRSRPCSCSRTCTGRTRRRSTSSPCSPGGSGRCPSLLLLTCRDGEAPPGHPARGLAPRRTLLAARAAVGERRRVALRATAQTTSTPSPEATRSTSPSCSPRVRPRSCRARSRTPCGVASSRLSEDGAAPGRARLGRAEPCRHVRARRGVARLARSGGGARAPGAARGPPPLRPLPPRARAQCDQVEHPDRGAAAAPRARSSPRCSPRTPIPPTSSTTPRRPARRTSSPTTRSWRRGERRRSTRTARRTPTTAAPLRSSTGFLQPTGRPSLEELAGAAYAVYRLEDAFEGDRACDRRMDGASATGRRSGAARRSSPGFYWHAGDGDAARREGARGDRDPRAARRVGRARPRLQRPRPAQESSPSTTTRRSLWGERALELATKLGDERTRAHVARQHRQRQAGRRPPPDLAAARGSRIRGRGRRASTRRRARSATSAMR